MAQFIVTAIDITSIQSYIFGSNRLQENIGASELVRLATGEWALEIICAVSKGHHNVENSKTGKLNEEFIIENNNSPTDAEVIYAGGGNIVILFRHIEKAKEFTSIITTKVLKEAPGLSLVVAHDQFEWDHQKQTGDRALSKVVQDLLGVKLSVQKASRLPSLPLLGLGVTAACESTSLVAVTKTKDRKLISRETEAKLEASVLANTHLKEEFEQELENWFDFPSDIDDMGRIKGEDSYLAIVHADGNGMGKRIRAIADDHPDPKDNREYIRKIRNFSTQLKEATRQALNIIVGRLTRSLQFVKEKNEELIAGVIPVNYDRKKDRYLLPFRPLIFGGDDVTFICNGNVGLALASAFLEAFEYETERYLNEKLYACAGIAIVKMHYPFARAYQLCEKLIKEAKRLVKDKQASALDWHFATSGLIGSLNEIRDHEYKVSSGNLLMRPLLLRPEKYDQDGRAWLERIERLVRVFQYDEEWSQKRNKVKLLREALREGPKAVERFCLLYELDELPAVIPHMDAYREDGWSSRCGYFDAIELIDNYISLEE